MGEGMPYNDYGSAMRRRLGGRVQKIAIDAGLGCPHRDVSSGAGGCTFCLNEAFSPSYCREAKGITAQIDRGLAFHAARGRRADVYIAYFQAGTNTNAPIEHLEQLFEEALHHPAIGGIIIGTRADCVNSEKLAMLERMSHRKYLAVEYGIESANDATLRHINRGHNYAAVVRAVEATKGRGLDVGGHIIIGLPGEGRDEILQNIERINPLSLDSIKFHQLQIYRSTPMAEEWLQHPERFIFGREGMVEEYVELMCDVLLRLNPATAVERMVSSAPRHLLLHSPFGGIRPDEVQRRIVERLRTLR